MSKKQTQTNDTVKVRLLRDCAYGLANAVVQVASDEFDAQSMDKSKEAVEYAESLKK